MFGASPVVVPEARWSCVESRCVPSTQKFKTYSQGAPLNHCRLIWLILHQGVRYDAVVSEPDGGVGDRMPSRIGGQHQSDQVTGHGA